MRSGVTVTSAEGSTFCCLVATCCLWEKHGGRANRWGSWKGCNRIRILNQCYKTYKWSFYSLMYDLVFICYLNQRYSSIDRALAQAVSRRSAQRRSGSISGQSVCRLKCTKWQCAQFRQRSLLLSWPEEADKAWEPSVTDIREQCTEMYLRRMDFTGLIRLPCPVLQAVIMQFCTTDWSVSGFPSWVPSHLAGNAASSHSVTFMWIEESNKTSIS